MANNVLCRIDFDGSVNGGGANFDTPTWGNNLSATSMAELDKNKQLPPLFVIGGKVEENLTYGEQGQKYGIRGGLVNEQGQTSTDLTLTVKGTNNALINNITIYFDKANNQFATEYIIDGETKTNDDPVLTLKWETSVTSKTITFTKWNRSNFNAVVQYLSFELNNKEFNWSHLKSVEFTDQIRPYQSEPFFDVMSSIGTVTLRDIDGELKDWANDGILESNLPIEIEVNGYKTKIAIVESWQNYNSQNKQLQANLSDKANYLDTQFSGIILTENINAYNVLKTICVPTMFTESNFENALQKIIIVGYGANKSEKTIKAYLESIEIKYAYLEADTMRNSIKKILTIAMLVMVTTTAGVLIFDTARPRITESEKNVTTINPNGQIGTFDEDLQTDNNYDNTEYEEDIIVSNSEHLEFSYTDIDDSYVYVVKNFGETLAFINADIGYIKGLNLTTASYIKIDIEYESQLNIEDIIFTDAYINSTSVTYVPDVPNSPLSYTFANGIAFSGFETISSELQTDDERIKTNGGYLPNYVYIKEKGLKTIKASVYIGAGLLGYANVYESAYQGLLPFKPYSILSTVIINGENISFETDTTYKKANANSKIYSIQKNELMQVNTKINNENIGSYISNCIIEDYSTKKGIRKATMTVTGSIDYSDTNGNKVVVWNGEGEKPTILEKGMIVIPKSNKKDNEGNYIPYSTYTDGTPRIWKITGVQSRLAENNRFTLELMEVFL